MARVFYTLNGVEPCDPLSGVWKKYLVLILEFPDVGLSADARLGRAVVPLGLHDSLAIVKALLASFVHVDKIESDSIDGHPRLLFH